MEASSEPSRAKLAESIQRSAQLLNNGKHYEFAQKIKMLAQRKIQTQKYAEGEILLILGINKMFEAQKIQLNAAHDLIDSLLSLYESQNSLWKESSPHQIFQLLTKQQNPKNIEYFIRIVKKIAKLSKCPEIAEFIISSFQKSECFQQAQSFVVHLQLSRVNRFLEKWHQKVDNQEYTIIVCRMALLKGLHYDFDQTMVLLSQVDAHNPFVKFTRFLVQVIQLKSRECYEKMGVGYKKFLDSDHFFGEIFESYGVKFFKNQKKGSKGIL